MIRVYLNNRSYWFNSHKDAADFMRNFPDATLREFSTYWDAAARQWKVKP
jgi:hypothetical protein